MHNRDMTWNTADGRTLKLRYITTVHLCNIEKHIENNRLVMDLKYGKERMESCKFNINQEIRLRKLNRIQNSEERTELF